MKREVSELIRRMRRPCGDSPPIDSQVYLARSLPRGSVLVHITGTGKERATAGMKALLDRPDTPDCILSLGFAGALREDLATGDLVLSRRLYATGEEAFFESDRRLLSLAQDTLKGSEAPRHFIADTLTVTEPVLGAVDKQRLGLETNAWVANMEDYWIGRASTERGIPFLSVRAVVDTARQDLPSFVVGLGDKGPLMQALHVAANVIARPWDVTRIMALSEQAKIAQDNLAIFGLSFVAIATAGGVTANP